MSRKYDECVVDCRSYTLEMLENDLKARINWGSRQQPVIHGFDMSSGGKRKVLNDIVGVSNKHQQVNLYLCALGPDGVLKDTIFILVRAECPYIQSIAARVISTKNGS